MSRLIHLTRHLLTLPAAFLLTLMLLLGGKSALAQVPIPPLDDNTSGTFYCISYPDTVNNALDSRWPNQRVRTEGTVWIFSPVANRVKITTFGTASDVLTLEAGKFKVYQFKAPPVVDVINSVSRRTATIEADYPVVVYCYFASIQGLEAWTPIPVDRWGTEYYAAALPGEVVLEIGIAGETEVPHTAKPGPSEILVIAAFDNTKVTLTPAAGLRFVGGPPLVVTLNQGEAYLVQSRVVLAVDADHQDDLGGSLIQSDKPIGVISGNTRAQIVVDEVGLKNNAYKNLMIEWLTPTEQHGTKFVYMPTWDGHRPGIGAAAERKREFARIYNTNGATTKGFYVQPGGTTQVPFSIKRDTLMEFANGQPSATYYQTERPAQAMMHSSAIVKFNGSIPCFSGLPCLSYDAWAPYMVEMTPREQWPTFAPYYAPTNPGALQHYVSVVTDTITQKSVYRESGATFIFTRRIPGTDLVWGTMSVSPGEDHWLEARNGGGFYGVVFGIMQGDEEYRPGAAKKKDDGKKIAGGGGSGAPRAMDPCAYEEYNAVSYGYPLAPGRRVLKPSDTLQIDTVMDCTTLTIHVRAINDKPVGLRTITLDLPTVKNARLLPVDPQRLSDILSRSECTVKVEPIDPTKDAEATVLIKDRTGKIWKVYYHYEAERVIVQPATLLDFGEMTAGTTATKTVVLRNPLTRPLEIKELKLADGNQGYAIVRSTPPVPTKLQPGDSMIIEISSTPALDNHLYVDTLKVTLGCIKIPLPLNTATAQPKIYVEDVQFGLFVLGRDGARTKDMNICNVGSGEIRFDNPNDPDPTKLITWPDPGFTIDDPTEITKLKNTVLKAGECIKVKVTFTPTTLGSFRTVARVWANTRYIRDTSVWTALVVEPGPVLTGYDWGKRWLSTLNGCTKSGVPFYEALVMLNNVGTSDDEVVSLTLIGADADSGFFRFDSSDRSTAVRPGDVLRKDSASPRYQKVLFLPKDERDYRAIVRLVTASGDTIEQELRGTGIESHGAITGIDYGQSNFSGPYPLTAAIEKTATVTARQTRPLTITNVIVIGANPGDFWINPADLPVGSWTLQPGESRTVRVEFRPQFPGTRTATIAFVGDHSFCDDSTNSLVGYTFTKGVETQGWDFGAVLACDEPRHDVLIRNNGSEPIRVRGAAFDQPTPYFRMDQSGITFPVDLPPNGVLSIPVDFIPAHAGAFSANVLFDVVDPKNDSVLAAAPALVQGTSFTVEVPAKIGEYRGAPGSVVDAAVTIDKSPTPNNLKSFFLSVYYDARLVQVINGSNSAADKASLLDGTICAGWDITVMPSQPGEFQAVLTAPAGASLGGPGKVLNLKFQLYLAEINTTKLNLFMVPVADNGKQCMRFVPTPGRIDVDSICGINLRLIESTGFNYSLGQNKPNPFNPTTEILFSLGLDGPTRLVVYDASGRKVATLIDAYMKPGTYQVSWDATGYPSGLYYYRLESGVWTRTNTMILRK